MHNHQKNNDVKLIDDGPSCMDMRSTHLLICGTLRSRSSSKICYGRSNGISSKANEIRTEPYPKLFNHPCSPMDLSAGAVHKLCSGVLFAGTRTTDHSPTANNHSPCPLDSIPRRQTSVRKSFSELSLENDQAAL